MISWMRRRLRRRTADEGITLVEVIVAMMIFALVSSGFVYSMLSIITITRDSRARTVAANLAAEEIDLARGAEDLFALVDDQYTEKGLGSETYYVTRTTSWVSNPADEFSCGGGGVSGGKSGQLRYKRVHVEVTWAGMREGTEPVRSDTVINPAQRLNDPTLGTIIVSVLNGAGTGSQGVKVSTDKSVGAVISDTDKQGCTYILKVKPDTYTVSLSKSNFVDSKQQATPSQTVSVAAGQSTTVGFQYDQAAVFTTNLAANAPNPAAVKLPKGMPVTFENSYGSFTPPAATGGDTATRTYKLHPFSAGYSVFAGSCTAANPVEWPAETVPGGTLRGEVEPVAAPGGGTATAVVPMALLQITAPNAYITAVSDTPAAGLPGCETQQKLTFDKLNGSTTIALPYGTWRLYYGGSSGSTASSLTAVAPAAPPAPERTTVESGNRVVLDPRVVVAP